MTFRPHPHLTPEWVDRQLGRSASSGLPHHDEELFDTMIDEYNDSTKGPRIWRRINPNWDYKEDVLRRTRDDIYMHTRYSKYRPESFDWEKAVLRDGRPKVKSLATVSRVNFRECAARNERLSQLKKIKA